MRTHLVLSLSIATCLSLSLGCSRTPKTPAPTQVAQASSTPTPNPSPKPLAASSPTPQPNPPVKTPTEDKKKDTPPIVGPTKIPSSDVTPDPSKTDPKKPPVGDKVDPPKVDPAAKNDPPPPKKSNVVIRQRELLTLRPEFQQLGIAYSQIVASNGKGPKDFAELKPNVQLKELLELIQMGYVVVFYGVNPLQLPEGTSNTILAYEIYESPNGTRLVLMADGSVRDMSTADFLKAPKAK